MKNAAYIINSLQSQPQFHKIVEYKCINSLKSALLPTFQNILKYGYIKNSTLYLVFFASLNKLDMDNIINIIKSILNSPMIIKSQNFLECNDMNIKDVVCIVDHKPKKGVALYSSNSQNTTYAERAKADITVNMHDKKLQELAESILEIIRAKSES